MLVSFRHAHDARSVVLSGRRCSLDVLAYDPGFHYLYVASESGPVSVFRVASAAVTRIGDIRVGPNAHVVVVDPATHRVYFPLKNLGGRTALRIFEPRQ